MCLRTCNKNRKLSDTRNSLPKNRTFNNYILVCVSFLIVHIRLSKQCCWPVGSFGFRVYCLFTHRFCKLQKQTKKQVMKWIFHMSLRPDFWHQLSSSQRECILINLRTDKFLLVPPEQRFLRLLILASLPFHVNTSFQSWKEKSHRSSNHAPGVFTAHILQTAIKAG